MCFARADRVAGSAIERLTNAHHARRLGKLGRSAQRTPPDDGRLWAAGQPPPRVGNALDVLIEGAAYFPALEQAIRCARRSVLIAGWCITPGFAVVRHEPPVLLRELLAEAAETVDVRVLLWAGAPAPVFAPRRASVRAGRDELVHGTRIKAALDSHERPMHCHHEKLVVIDDDVAFVGGIDLTDLGGDRYRHARASGARAAWAGTTSPRGCAGRRWPTSAAHFAQRWHEVTGERLDAQPAGAVSAGDLELQIVRTVPEKHLRFAPRGRLPDPRGVPAGAALRPAPDLPREPVPVVAGDRGHPRRQAPPAADRRVSRRHHAARQAEQRKGRHPRATRRCSLKPTASGGRFLAYDDPRARSGNTSDRVYVHAKVGIVDDRWLTVGSANLNDHSFFNDTEVNLVTCDPMLARNTRLRLWAAHLERNVDEVAADPTRVIDELWRPIAAEQRERRNRGEPLTHGLVELQPNSHRSERLLGPLQALVVDG